MNTTATQARSATGIEAIRINGHRLWDSLMELARKGVARVVDLLKLAVA